MEQKCYASVMINQMIMMYISVGKVMSDIRPGCVGMRVRTYIDEVSL